MAVITDAWPSVFSNTSRPLSFRLKRSATSRIWGCSVLRSRQWAFHQRKYSLSMIVRSWWKRSERLDSDQWLWTMRTITRRCRSALRTFGRSRNEEEDEEDEEKDS